MQSNGKISKEWLASKFCPPGSDIKWKSGKRVFVASDFRVGAKMWLNIICS